MIKGQYIEDAVTNDKQIVYFSNLFRGLDSEMRIRHFHLVYKMKRLTTGDAEMILGIKKTTASGILVDLKNFGLLETSVVTKRTRWYFLSDSAMTIAKWFFDTMVSENEVLKSDYSTFLELKKEGRLPSQSY